MSDDTTKTKGSDGAATKRKVLVGAALALVLIVGGGVLYVNRAGSGNEAAMAGCDADPAMAAAIDENARGEVAAVSPLDQPFDVSALAFRDVDDEATSLKDFAGKTLLVNLWATWCVPCRQEMPALDALEKQESGDDFAVIPINVDMGDAAKPKGFYEETDLKALPFYRDETMAVFNELKGKGLAIGLPVSLIVGPDGCARAAVNGPAEWASPDAVRLIDSVRGGGA